MQGIVSNMVALQREWERVASRSQQVTVPEQVQYLRSAQ